MPMINTFLSEFKHEAATTRRLLERVPDDRWDWKPHEKSFTLKELTQHMAEMPGWLVPTIEQDDLDMGGEQPPRPEIHDREELLALYDQNVERFLEVAPKATDEVLQAPWRLRTGDKVHFEVPRAAAIRTFIMSHLIHHRGQLSVYLRLLDVPLPSIYGPSADDNVFA